MAGVDSEGASDATNLTKVVVAPSSKLLRMLLALIKVSGISKTNNNYCSHFVLACGHT